MTPFRYIRNKVIKITIGLITGFVAISVLLFFLFHETKQKKYIAYIGKSATTLSKLDNLQTSVFMDFIYNINKDLKNYKIELLVYNIRGEATVSDSIYNIISKDKDILFVIDNTHGSDIIYAQETIKKNNTPVFFINADKNDKDYGDAAIFTGNGDNFPYELSAYLKNIERVKEVNFISESDYKLNETFLKAFKRYNIKIKDSILVKREFFTDSARQSIYKIFELKNKSVFKKNIFVVNTHSKWGDEIISYFENNFNDVKIIGGDYIAELKGLYKFGSISKNQLIIAGEPTDALSESMLNHLSYYEKKYPDPFDRSNAPYFTKRCLTVSEFIEKYLRQYDKQKKISLSTAILFQTSLKNNIFEGKENLYTIDSIGILKKETSFTSYKDGKLYSLPIHINQIGQKIPNMIFGIDIIDIHNVNINDNTFAADYFYWIRIDTSFKMSEKDIVFQNIKQDESNSELVMEKRENNSLYKLFKVSGKFYNDFSLTEYPLDKQEIRIQVDMLKPADSLKISFDQRSIQQNPSFIERFNVPGWIKLKSNFTIDNRISRNMRGAFEENDESPKLYKSLNFRLDIKRKMTKPVLEIILPLFLIGISAIALLFVKDLSFSNIGGASVGSLLAIITFSIALAVIIPSSDYLTKADYFFWTAFFEVLACFIIIIYINFKYSSEVLRSLSVKSLRMILLFFFLVAFLIIFLV